MLHLVRAPDVCLVSLGAIIGSEDEFSMSILLRFHDIQVILYGAAH